MKYFVKALNTEGGAFKYLAQRFSYIIEAMLKEVIVLISINNWSNVPLNYAHFKIKSFIRLLFVLIVAI